LKKRLEKFRLEKSRDHKIHRPSLTAALWYW